MWGYDVEFDGYTAMSQGMYIVRRPDIPAPGRSFTEYSVPRRGGIMYRDNGVNDDIKIPVDFNFIGKPDEWFELFRKSKKWLLNPGRRQLIFGDDKNYFFWTKKVEIGTAERICYEIGKFTAVFFCEGYQYRTDGTKDYSISEVEKNPYDESMPEYKIKGEGVCTLTVNGKSMTANVGQNLTIDTWRRIAYREDGTIQNTNITGWYEDLHLMPGDNKISITAGFVVKVIPNWRCS